MAPQEPQQGSWLPGSLRGLAPQKPEPGRLLPGVTIYHHPNPARCGFFTIGIGSGITGL